MGWSRQNTKTTSEIVTAIGVIVTAIGVIFSINSSIHSIRSEEVRNRPYISADTVAPNTKNDTSFSLYNLGQTPATNVDIELVVIPQDEPCFKYMREYGELIQGRKCSYHIASSTISVVEYPIDEEITVYSEQYQSPTIELNGSLPKQGFAIDELSLSELSSTSPVTMGMHGNYALSYGVLLPNKEIILTPKFSLKNLENLKSDNYILVIGVNYDSFNSIEHHITYSFFELNPETNLFSKVIERAIDIKN